jgi:hypothetical protein
VFLGRAISPGPKIVKPKFRNRIYLYNILGWSSFPSIRPVIRPVILIPEEEDDGTGGGRQLMAAAAVYPNILTIRNFFKTYKINIFKHETRKGNTVK